MKKILFILLIFSLISASYAQNPKPSNNGINYIYAIILPVLAVLFTLLAFIRSDIPIVSLMASILCFISGLATSNIRWIGKFGSDTYYNDYGNPELSVLFYGFGVLMAIYTIYLVGMNILKPEETR
jgi:hypothetical protein